MQLLSIQQVQLIEIMYKAPKNRIAVLRKHGHRWTETMFILESLKSIYITYTDRRDENQEFEKIVFGLSPCGLIIASLMFGPPDSGLPKWMPPQPRQPVILNAGSVRK